MQNSQVQPVDWLSNSQRMLLTLSDGAETDFLSKATCKCLEILSAACEKNFSFQLLTESIIPQYIAVAMEYRGDDRGAFWEFFVTAI